MAFTIYWNQIVQYLVSIYIYIYKDTFIEYIYFFKLISYFSKLIAFTWNNILYFHILLYTICLAEIQNSCLEIAIYIYIYTFIFSIQYHGFQNYYFAIDAFRTFQFSSVQHKKTSFKIRRNRWFRLYQVGTQA